MNPEIRSPKEVVEAFQCFVSDATSGLQGFEEFCSELGYDTDSRAAERTHKACQLAAKKLGRIYQGDLYELHNDLIELENNY